MKLAVVALTAVCSLGAVVLAQNTPAFQPPRTADGKPDFTGIYQWPTYLPGAQRGRSAATVFDSKNFAPFKPGGENFLEPRTGDPRHDEPRDFCLPAGFPGSILSGNAMQWFQTKNYLTIVHEFQRNSRIIPLDGRPHRTGMDPLYDGDPVGRWDGDTLVIDTTKLVDESWLGADGWFHSNKAHVVERLTRKGDALTWAATVDDPVVFTKTWEMTPRTLRLNPNPKVLLEEDPPCLEQDGPHIVTDDHH
jgi:hypothetical protein